MAKSGDKGIFEKQPGSGVWYARYRDATGHDRLKCAGTKAQARTLYREMTEQRRLVKIYPEMVASTGGSRVAFAEIAADALIYCERHADPQDDKERMSRMLEWWTTLPASSLTPREIESRFDTMTVRSKRRADHAPKLVSNATVNRYRALLSLTYRLAQKHGKVQQGFNPARLVERRKENQRVRWLGADEERRLREVIAREYPDKPWQYFLDLALNCGLRWGDQAKLAREHRDGDVLRLRINKTDEPLALRLNPIAATAFDALEAEADGEALHATKGQRHWFKRCLKLAAIEDFRWHDIRHTFATRLLQAGVPAEKVQRLLGHKTITMTLRYAHVVAGYHDDALERLGEINQRCVSGGAAVVPIRTQAKGYKLS